MPAGDWLNEPGGLAERLDRLLQDAGLGRNELAQRLGWVPSKVSKLTHGQQAPSPEDIDAWCGACGHPEEAAALRAMLAEGRTRHRTYQRQARTSQAATQRRWAAMVHGARRIRNAELIHIPGLLQTPGYARARLTESARLNGHPEDAIDQAVTERIRRAEVLYSGKQFEFLIYEAALYAPLAPPEEMAAQLDRLIMASGIPNVTVAIIPSSRPLPVTPGTFFLADGEGWVETHVSDIPLRADESETLTKVADALLAEAVTGDEARALITKAGERWRQAPTAS